MVSFLPLNDLEYSVEYIDNGWVEIEGQSQSCQSFYCLKFGVLQIWVAHVIQDSSSVQTTAALTLATSVMGTGTVWMVQMSRNAVSTFWVLAQSFETSLCWFESNSLNS